MSLFEEYNKKFGEDIPTYGIPDSWDDEKVIEVIKECIRTGKPFKPDYEEGLIY